MLSEGNLENQDFGGNRGFDESHLSCKQEFAMHTSLSGVARALNARGVKTARGRVWEATTVRNVLRRGGDVEWNGAVLAGHRPAG